MQISKITAPFMIFMVSIALAKNHRRLRIEQKRFFHENYTLASIKLS